MTKPWMVRSGRYCLKTIAVVLSLSSSLQAKTFSTRDSSVGIDCASPLPKYEFRMEDGHSMGNTFLALLAATVAENWTDAAIRKDLTSWGFSDIFLIGKQWLGASGYIAEHKDFRILAFRGTHSIPEGLIDTAAMTVNYGNLGFTGFGHGGLNLSFQALWLIDSKELAERQERDPKPILVVGHSLGGSLAMLHAARLKKMGYPIAALYTAAQPRLGDSSLMQEFAELLGDRIYRLENEKDPVPHLPPTEANADVFADVFSNQGTIFNKTLHTTFASMNYAPLPGIAIQMTQEGFIPKVGRQLEMESEKAFIEDFDREFDASDNIAGIGIQLAKRVMSHIGDTYICSFLKLREAGYEIP